MALASRVKCTYADCMKTFPTEKDMRRHKINAPEHEYCNRCNTDCEDFKHLLRHKAISRRHIACAICGEDFRSAGGREIHVQQVCTSSTYLAYQNGQVLTVGRSTTRSAR